MSMLRRWAIPIGAVAALLLAYLVNPWVEPAETLRPVVTVAFWIASIVLALALFEDRKAAGSSEVEIEGPAVTRFLFNNSRAGLLWLPIRLFVGFSWLPAGPGKFPKPPGAQGGPRPPAEPSVPAGRFRVDQPGPVPPRHRPDPGLEGGRVLRRRPVSPAASRGALEPGSPLPASTGPVGHELIAT